jgi:hypothetical protein
MMRVSPKAPLPEIVPENIQPVLCITVMGGDDMEPYISSFVSNLLCFFHFRLLGVLGRAGRIKEVDMGIRARMPDSQ